MANTTSQPGAPATAEPAWPHPPRFWWTKRIVVGALIFMLLLAGTWVWWAWEASRRLQAEIDALRARGEPVLPIDFKRPATVPDYRNAVQYLRLAIDAMHPQIHSPSATTMDWDRDRLPYPQEWMKTAAPAVEANADALVLARQARHQAAAEWNLQFTATPVLDELLVALDLNAHRHLANLLTDIALYKHFIGDDAAALEYVRDVMSQADAMDEAPLMVSHLMAQGIRRLAMHRLALIATGLTVSGAAALPDNAEAPADRSQVEALIRDLLDEPRYEGRLRQAATGDRMVALDHIMHLAQSARVLRPMFYLDACRFLQAAEVEVEASVQPHWPAAKALYPPATSSEPHGDIPPVHRLMSHIMQPSNRPIQTSHAATAHRRTTAIALATRLHFLDHGQYPQTLDQLVPNYLPIIPADPFAADGRSLGYLLAAGGTRPVVYSVGADENYSPFDESMLQSKPVYYEVSEWLRQRPAHEWRDLSGWSP